MAAQRINMTILKYVLLGVLVGSVVAEPPAFQSGIPSSYGPPTQEEFGGYGGSDSYSGGGYGGNQEGYGQNHVSKPYEFGYSVKDPNGLDHGREETGDGHNVRGSYRVLLPDGRTQIVTYHADWKTGYHADVRYEGEAKFPEQGTQNDGEGYNYAAPTKSFSEGSGTVYTQGFKKR